MTSTTSPARRARHAGRIDQLPIGDDLAVIDLHSLARLLGVGLSTLRRWRAAGRLPAPLPLGGRVLRWTVSAIRAWLAQPAA